jgi:hypothetical protein
MHQWVKPRRTMTPPPSMRPAHRMHIPDVVDLAMRVQAPHKRLARAAPDAPAEAAEEDAVNVADMVISYSPSEFHALRGSGDGLRGEAFNRLAATLWEAVGVTVEDRTGSPVPALGAKFPASPKETPRKKYFDHSELHHKVLAVLNKVSSDAAKYSEVRNELHRLPLPTATDEQLTRIAEIFFSKATTEPKFASQYALLVAELAVMPPGKATGDVAKTLAHRLRIALVGRCQSEFERTRHVLWQSEDRNDDADELDRHKRRYRETLRFVGHLFLHDVLSKEVIRSIVTEILPPYNPPTDYDIDGLCALLATVTDRFVNEEPKFLADVLARLDELSSANLSTRSHCLVLNLRADLTKKLPAEMCRPRHEVARLQTSQRPMDREKATSIARRIMHDLATSADFDRAITQLTATEDIFCVLHMGVGRALTTPRADKERQQLPTLMRYLVHRGVLTFQQAQTVVFSRAIEAVETREWETSPKLWRHWAQILSEDLEPHAVLHQTMHTDIFLELAVSTTCKQDDLDHYLLTVANYNEEHGWAVEHIDPLTCPRFRYLSVLVAVASFDDLDVAPLQTVQRLLRGDDKSKEPLRDIEASLFVALCERRDAGLFEQIREHPHRGGLLMVQKVMSAVLAAAVAMQDAGIALNAMDLLHLVVDGPDRALREALILSEIVESGSRMHGQMRSSAIGFQLAKALKDREVVSEQTMQEAHRVYAHPRFMDLLGPYVGTPFVSAPAITAGPS